VLSSRCTPLIIIWIRLNKVCKYFDTTYLLLSIRHVVCTTGTEYAEPTQPTFEKILVGAAYLSLTPTASLVQGKVLLQLFNKSKLINGTKTFLEPNFFSL